MKVIRQGTLHRVKEITASIFFEGVFEKAYLSSDNSQVVPTDTIKNTATALAQDHLGESIEAYALFLGRTFLRQHPQIRAVYLDFEEKPWEPISLNGKAHDHSFSCRGGAVPITKIKLTRENEEVRSGLRDLLILKSTASGFAGFVRDSFTALPETTDRIFATSLCALWTFCKGPIEPNLIESDYSRIRDTVVSSLLRIFADSYSPSVQRSLYQMGEEILATVPEIEQIELQMPNKHYLPVALHPFGIESRNEIFLPTDEPYGEIEAVISRSNVPL